MYGSSELSRRVRHPRWGEGLIIAIRDRGHTLQVRFDRGVSVWVKSSELDRPDGPAVDKTLISKSQSVTLPGLPSRSDGHKSSGFRARSLVEALRLGIVPHGEVPSFTFGRSEELAAVKEWLTASDRNSLLLVGEYGSGKTHFLECLVDLALREGFACAITKIEPNESPFSRPKQVYRRLVKGFVYKDRNGRIRDFRHFLQEAAQEDDPLWERNPLLSRIRWPMKGRYAEDYQWDWIEGRETSWGDLHDHSTAANIYCNLLSSFSILARDALGLKGLVLLMDEAETMDQAAKLQMRRGLNFMRGLTMVAENDRRLVKDEPEKMFGESGLSAAREWGIFGTKTGLRYDGMLRVPFTADSPAALKVAFAFAPAIVLDLSLFDDIEKLELPPLSSMVLAEAAKAGAQKYKTAYGFALESRHRNALASTLASLGVNSTRLFLKATVEALDLLRLFPDEDPDVLLSS